MATQSCLLLANVILINISFLLSFLIRYGLPFPENNFIPYKKSFVFLTLIYVGALAVFGVYKSRFKSSWVLFQRVSLGVFLGTLLCVAFVYVFRVQWGAFPTSVFAISFLVNLLLIFKVNQFILKAKKKIKKQVVILGEGKVDDIVGKKANVERKRIDQIRELLEYSNVDEIVISEKITTAKDLNLLLYLGQKLKAEILFSPSVYIELLPERINGNSSVKLLGTFVGRQSDLDEFLITMLDIAASIGILLVLWPAMLLISLLIKLTSSGHVLYKQQRVGKDGKTFTLYKFRTMVKDAEKKVGPVLASQNDTRVTKIGKILRVTRIDELPQLFNVLCGQMSLVGPRPERPHFVKMHKALQGLRLAVKPGLTGLAQVNSFYDLHPKHKIKYDYLYVQRRTLALNIKIMLQTIPVLFSKKGW
ncbi:MAG: exopolysaccharide biosynthesis polyprenyl glycosylphosphotransferase [Phycisphaerae bacterium]|nr:exopolysaccharide biosynthesis polyprenyl glycosylphosphotransferase [Phycisphaerae bacterium]